MARQKRTQFTGTIAQPIDDSALILSLAYDLDSPEGKKAQEEWDDRLHGLRVEKMPELARQLGMQLEKFDLTTHTGLMVFYATIAMNLAVEFKIPGFFLVRSKWQREVVKSAMKGGDIRKRLGLPNPDLTACLLVVQALYPDLARAGRKSEATRRAKTLRNQVSKLRQRLNREAAAEAKRNLITARSIRLVQDGSGRLH
jgi:hypothetical protein